MAICDHSTPTPCRQILGASAALLLIGSAGPAHAADHPDAALLALCAEFETLQRRQNGLWSWLVDGELYEGPHHIKGDDERRQAEDALDSPIWDTHLQIYDIRATTLDGLQAKVRCLLLADPGARRLALDEEGGDGIGINPLVHNLIGTLLRDLSDGSISSATCADGPMSLVREA